MRGVLVSVCGKGGPGTCCNACCRVLLSSCTIVQTYDSNLFCTCGECDNIQSVMTCITLIECHNIQYTPPSLLPSLCIPLSLRLCVCVCVCLCVYVSTRLYLCVLLSVLLAGSAIGQSVGRFAYPTWVHECVDV